MAPTIVAVQPRVLPDEFNPQLLVDVMTDDGLTGIGECWWGLSRPTLSQAGPVAPIASMIGDILAPLSVGRDASSIEAIWDALVRQTYQYGHEGIVLTALSGLDLALWDLAGQRAGVPTAELLGEVVHRSMPVYASLSWLRDEGRVRADAARAVEAGIRGVKLHEFDPELAHAVREEVGPDVAIMVDVNGHFDSVSAAVSVGRRLAEADVLWFEEPVWPMRDHDALAQVRVGAGLPIAAGENEFALESFARLLSAAAVDILQPEIAKFGGLTPAREIARLADEHDVAICPHNYSMGPSWYASLHWAAVSPGARWLEMPWLPEGMSFPSGVELPEVVDGMVALPAEPGLGTKWPRP